MDMHKFYVILFFLQLAKPFLNIFKLHEGIRLLKDEISKNLCLESTNKRKRLISLKFSVV